MSLINSINPQSFYPARTIVRDSYVSRKLKELERHHLDTALHCKRVGLVSIDLGFELGIERGLITTLGTAAYLHDIGKLSIDSETLDRTGGLSDEDKRKLLKHPEYGFELLDDCPFELVRELVVSHHEYQVDSYPKDNGERRTNSHRDSDIRKEFSLNLRLAEILAVVDFTDALRCERSYKPSYSEDKTRRILEKEFIGDSALIPLVLKHYKNI